MKHVGNECSVNQDREAHVECDRQSERGLDGTGALEVVAKLSKLTGPVRLGLGRFENRRKLAKGGMPA
jgi:hypothetical protein